MTLKRFEADLCSARSRIDHNFFPSIMSLENGKQKGEVVATFVHEDLPMPILIHLVAADTSAYPDGNNFLLSTDTPDIHPALNSALEDLKNFTFGQTILESLRDVSMGLNRILSHSNVDADGDTIMDGAANNDSASDDESYEVEFGEDGYDEDQDFIFGLGSTHQAQESKASGPGAETAFGAPDRMRRDLRKAREAGVKIGILSGVKDHAPSCMLSLSIKVRKLGISDEALEAWEIDPSDYVVLLLSVNKPYPSVEKLLERPLASIDADFRFGKCKRSKPSADSARKAFDTPGEQNATAHAADNIADSHLFSKSFISSSLDQFMHEQFFALTKLRLAGCQSWDDANSQILNLARSGTSTDIGGTTEFVDPKGEEEEQVKEKMTPAFYQGFDTDTHEQQTLPTILTWDSFAQATEDISMPLVAMQFALHYFVRCTEYCLRCHRKVKKEFEALKPFVCEDPLCLFQYITMGFGPSIEHEILSQPYVVDLLVTLCYSSILPKPGDVQAQVPGRMGGTPSLAAIPTRFMRPPWNLQAPASMNGGPPNTSQEHPTYPIRDFPMGLRLKVPSLPPFRDLSPMSMPGEPTSNAKTQADSYSTPIKVLVDWKSRTLILENQEDVPHLTGNSWVVLHQPETGRYTPTPTGSVLVHHVYLKYIDGLTKTVNFGTVLLGAPSSSPWDPLIRDAQPMDLYKYDLEFDDLDNAGKAKAMVAILDTLPPISLLREHLINHPHTLLRSYHGISPSAATLLTWIVSSNRSFIVQVNNVTDVWARDSEMLKTIKTRDLEVIPSLSQGYVQFRFAMGNPAKELRFQRALKEVTAKEEMKYPTLFAWHGSPVQNWHSILRQGLDFTAFAHGRAFGDGVYLSRQYDTSQHYTQKGFTNWQNSALSPAGVVALCEIINSPDKFVSSSPHYVVSQLDWIQCRYLFIKLGVGFAPQNLVPSVQSDSTATELDITDELPQDPGRIVLGPGARPLKIPRKALPASRGGNEKSKETESPSSKRSHDSDDVTDDTDEEDADDLSAIASDDESPRPPLKRTCCFTSGNPSIDTVTAHLVKARRPLTPSMTDFRPGTLDFLSIPQLALPEWTDVNSSKRLASDIKLMQKAQATTPLHELGWYIDFSNIENMFQWIVELHTFDPDLPLAKDMKNAGITSIVLEVRFGRDYPVSPPFIRVIRPKFVPFMHGGGGHVTIGGAICLEMLTSTGWTVTTSMEAVLISVKMAMSSLDPQPARLQSLTSDILHDYSAYEALDAFRRFANRHGWKVPPDAAASAIQEYRPPL